MSSSRIRFLVIVCYTTAIVAQAASAGDSLKDVENTDNTCDVKLQLSAFSSVQFPHLFAYFHIFK